MNIRDDITPLILTYNEAPNIGRALEQLRWAHRVVVLDSGSTDATPLLAERHPNVDFVKRPFDDHTTQWNHGVDLVRTPWVLALDADYILDDAFERELLRLSVSPNVAAFFASFDYWVGGRPLRASLYPPRAVLFRKDRCRYVADGHTQRLQFSGVSGELGSIIHHDDRKPLRRWISSQNKYAKMEAAKLLATPLAELRIQDRLRRTGWAAIPATLVYTLVVKRTFLDGWRGWFYAEQRTFAEVLLAIRLWQERLESAKAGHGRS